MATAIVLRLRVNNTTVIHNHRFVKLFSSSSSSSSSPSSNPNVEDENTTQSPSSNSSTPSFLSDVRAKLKQQSPQQQRQPHSPLSARLSTNKSPSVSNFQAIRESLADYRIRAAPPPPRGVKPSSPDISLEEIYKRNVIPQGGESSNSFTKGGRLNFQGIAERLRQPNRTTTGGAISPSRLPGGNLGWRPLDPNQSEPSKSIGGEQQNLPASVFQKEIGSKWADESWNKMKKKFVRTYSKKELGQLLKELRPEEAKGSDKGFSLNELNERLIKLRVLDQNKASLIPGIADIRESIMVLSEQDNSKKSFTHKIEIMSQIGGTPKYLLSPPKEQLVEKYFHPDNMSSAEKMKLELQRVRDEFKMSESDCGSSRVQVALLTTKIKHLSTALHKKDKHSRKGLQAMVQKRKKLLKYMRRTDWDSYCLVLSKLGLRDNPDYKN